MTDATVLSVVIPVYNNDPAVLGALVSELSVELDKLGVVSEVVFVDDGSGEDTKLALEALVSAHARIRVVELVANFGQHAAFSAGFEFARGRFIVTMDGDGQSDPRDIPRLTAPLEQGYDMVSGVRRHREDPAFRQLSSRLVTRLVGRLTHVRLRDIGCPVNAFTADLARHLGSFGELRRFLKPLAVRLARRVTEVDVAHRPRPATRPTSSYSANGLVRLFMDFFVNSLGDVFAWVFLCGVGLSLLLGFSALLLAAASAVGGLTLVASLAAAGLALQAAIVAMLALAGDYVQRIYRQSSGRPFYLVRRVHEHAACQDGRGHVG